MIKKLVFSFYISEDTYSLKINRIHLNCIRHFKDSFDCAEISFICDDKDAVSDYILELESEFISIFIGKDIRFSIVKNNMFRESSVFYDKIAKRLSDNELVFFAHNKGVTNETKYDKTQIYSWVCAMYYYSLNYMDEVTDKLINKKFFSYGSFLTKNDEPEKFNKYGWYYIGTFFWINSLKLYEYMKIHSIELPNMADRFYDEEFLGNIIDCWPLMMVSSHNNSFLRNCTDFYNHTTEYISLIYDTKTDGFDEFYKIMVE